MLQILDQIEMNDSVKLHVIKANKFKTNLIGIYIRRPLIKEEATKNSLLSMLLNKGTKEYPSFIQLNRKLEDLYGSILVSSVTKKGEKHIINLKMQMPNGKYINDKNILKEGLKILNDIINNSLVENNAFKKESFNQEKENLREKIKGRINDKMRFAVDRCVEEMCNEENYSIYEYGNIDDLERIDEKTLYEYFQNIISTSPIDIFIVGDVEEDKVKEMFSETVKIKREDIIDIPREDITKEITAVKEVEDRFNINQGKLTLGYRTNIPYESNLYESSILFSNILGGGPNSKLFKNVREKESLCYYIFSRIDKFKSIMLVSSGVEFENFEKTKELIKKEVKSLTEGNFTEEDIEIAKKSVITSIRSLTDAPNMLMDFLYSQILSNSLDTIENIINKIRAVNRESIIEAGKKFELDTIYFLNKEGEAK
ncbi:EF-P 5-aminopentanol modification-associated protein YfmF [Maledivibacter halophilus]|uniref:Predicted Zn-dependent peptidase n=1 Tax=Maledivibacter halophilus TaxID=36842 RepID=A0A1T5LSJ5_9FIRM|nr:pitrilysin family protein [Maledivibacter halophilus]SKC78900.1 Predicted Zn-dependent peptidase [Maledivibacter halophilus]